MIVYWLTKIVYYKLVKTIIRISSLVKFIINIVMRYNCLAKPIVSNKNVLFTSNF